MNKGIEILSSFNYDLLLCQFPDKFKRVSCNVPQYLRKFSGGYLCGSSALYLYGNQYNLNLNQTIGKTQASDFDLIFPIKNKLEQLLKLKNIDYNFRYIPNDLNRTVIKYRDEKCNVNYDLIFLYSSPYDIFLNFDFNFLCLLVDINAGQFILSTQFLHFLETGIITYKNHLYKGLNTTRIFKYSPSHFFRILPNRVTTEENSNTRDKYDLIQSFETPHAKFKRTVYKVIILSRIFKRILTIRKFNHVLNELDVKFNKKVSSKVEKFNKELANRLPFDVDYKYQQVIKQYTKILWTVKAQINHIYLLPSKYKPVFNYIIGKKCTKVSPSVDIKTRQLYTFVIRELNALSGFSTPIVFFYSKHEPANYPKVFRYVYRRRWFERDEEFSKIKYTLVVNQIESISNGLCNKASLTKPCLNNLFNKRSINYISSGSNRRILKRIHELSNKDKKEINIKRFKQ